MLSSRLLPPFVSCQRRVCPPSASSSTPSRPMPSLSHWTIVLIVTGARPIRQSTISAQRPLRFPGTTAAKRFPSARTTEGAAGSRRVRVPLACALATPSARIARKTLSHAGLRDAGKKERTLLLDHLAGDHEALDLVRALVDLRDLRVAHHALERVLADVAVAAEDLHRLGRDPHRRVRAEQLRHRARLGQLRVGHARVGHLPEAVEQSPSGLTGG